MTATAFLRLCDEILAVSSPFSHYDASKKPLSTLLNEMTVHVASSAKVDNEDELVIHGYDFPVVSPLCTRTWRLFAVLGFSYFY